MTAIVKADKATMTDLSDFSSPTLSPRTTNVKRVGAIHKHLTPEEFDLNKVKELAKQIYKDGLRYLDLEYRGNTSHTFSSVLVSLNNVDYSSIQDDLDVLREVVKAHRIMAELTWYKRFKERDRPIFAINRQKIFEIIDPLRFPPERLKKVGTETISPIEEQYDVECLKEAGSWLTPTTPIWKEYARKALEAGSAAQNKDVCGIIKSLWDIKDLYDRDKLSKWYVVLRPLEWTAIGVTTIELFNSEIEPQLQDLIKKGNEYTVGLVKILNIILQNPESTQPVKDKVVDVLITLLRKRLQFKLDNLKDIPEDWWKLYGILRDVPDLYAETRRFAAVVLNNYQKESITKIDNSIQEWYLKMNNKDEDNRHAQEKRDAEQLKSESTQKRVKLEQELSQLKSQQQPFNPKRTGLHAWNFKSLTDTGYSIHGGPHEPIDQSTLIPSSSPVTSDLDIQILEGEISKNKADEEALTEKIDFITAYEKSKNDELAFLEQLFPDLKK